MEKNSSSAGIPIFGLLFIFLVIGKLVGWFSISWLSVFLIPLIASIAWFIISFILIIGVVGLFAAIYAKLTLNSDEKFKKNKKQNI